MDETSSQSGSNLKMVPKLVEVALGMHFFLSFIGNFNVDADSASTKQIPTHSCESNAKQFHTILVLCLNSI